MDILTNEALLWCLVIAIVVLFILGLRFAAKKHMGTKVALAMLAVEKLLVTWVEEHAGTEKDGNQKKIAAEYIIKRFYPTLPSWVRIFISEVRARQFIEETYEQMLTLIKYNADQLQKDKQEEKEAPKVL